MGKGVRGCRTVRGGAVSRFSGRWIVVGDEESIVIINFFRKLSVDFRYYFEFFICFSLINFYNSF